MPQPTDYHDDWSYPVVHSTSTEDENVWGSILNDLVELDLDEEVIKKDTLVNRPAAASADRWFLATDELELFYDNGTDWKRLLPSLPRTDEPESITAAWTVQDATDFRLGSDEDFALWFDGTGTTPADELTVTADPTGTPLDVLRLSKTGDIQHLTGALTHGQNPSESITDSSTPKDLSFTGSTERDIHDETTIDISNGSTASATEDVTVTLYDGVDATGTQLATETQSITIASGGATTATFLTGDVALDTGDYFIEVTQSGTTLTIDSTTEYTRGATYETGQTPVGDRYLRNQDGLDIATVDAITQAIGLPNSDLSVGGRVTATDFSLNDTIHTVTRDSDWSGATGGAMIQSAIDAATAGDEVWIVGPGPDNPTSASESDVWEVTTHIQGFPDDLTLKAVGDPLLFLSDASDDDVIRVRDGENSTPAEDLTFEGLRIDGNRANNTKASDSNSDGGTRFAGGIYVKRSTGTLVRDVDVVDMHGYAVSINGSTHALVENCSADNCADDGFTTTDIDYSTAITQDVTFRNCQSTNCDDSGFEVDDGPRDVLFTGCYSEGSQDQYSVHTHGSTRAPDAPKHIKFKNSVAVGGDRGFLLGSNLSGSPEDYSIVDCRATGNAVSGIAADEGTQSTAAINGVTIKNVHINYAGTTEAIDLKQGAGLSHVEISDSTIILDGSASNAIVANDVNLRNATIENVEIDASAATSCSHLIPAPGRSGYHTYNLTIQDCEFHDGQEAAILLWGAGGDVEGCKIVDNAIYNNGKNTTASNDRRAGISIKDNTTGSATPSDNLIRGNRIYDDQGTKTQVYGVYRSGCDYHIHSDNILRGNATGAFGGTAGTNTVETDNII